MMGMSTEVVVWMGKMLRVVMVMSGGGKYGEDVKGGGGDGGDDARSSYRSNIRGDENNSNNGKSASKIQ